MIKATIDDKGFIAEILLYKAFLNVIILNPISTLQKKLQLILILSISLFFSCTSQKATYTQEDKEKIKSMYKEDQKIQQELLENISDSRKADSLSNEESNIFKKNKIVLDEMLKEKEFPGIKEVGKDNSQRFWLLVQHCDFDVKFQSNYLKMMKKELRKGNVDSTNYAYLVDRVLKNKGKKQLYGTQMNWDSSGNYFPYPIKDSTHVDNRRKEVGLEPLKEYIQSMYELRKNR